MESDPESEEEDVDSGDDYKPAKDESDAEDSDIPEDAVEEDMDTPSEDDASEIDSPVKKVLERVYYLYV